MTISIIYTIYWTLYQNTVSISQLRNKIASLQIKLETKTLQVELLQQQCVNYYKELNDNTNIEKIIENAANINETPIVLNENEKITVGKLLTLVDNMQKQKLESNEVELIAVKLYQQHNRLQVEITIGVIAIKKGLNIKNNIINKQNSRNDENGLSYIPKSTSSFIRHKYSVFTSKEMKQHISNLVNELSLTLNIDIEIVSLLLRRYEWKTECLMENYLSNSLGVLNEHNLHLINKKNDATLQLNPDLQIECNICVGDVKIMDTFSLDCSHRFCNECWSDYIISTINNKSFNSIFITCPGHICQTPIKNIYIKQFINNKIWNIVITSNSQQYRFCPTPGCNCILYVSLTMQLVEGNNSQMINKLINIIAVGIVNDDIQEKEFKELFLRIKSK